MNIFRRSRFHVEAAVRKGLFQRQTLWHLLMEVIGAGGVAYAGYSYRERADRYLREFTIPEAARLRESSGLVKYSTLSEQIRSVGFLQAELWVAR